LLRAWLVLTAVAMWLVSFAAGQPNAKSGAVGSPASGAELYTAHCASCHGKDGKGDGPAASALKVKPTDLTTIAQKNRGRFPGGNLFQIIKWGGAIASHGSKDMPVWGRELMASAGQSDAEVDQRIKSLVKYIESIQVK